MNAKVKIADAAKESSMTDDLKNEPRTGGVEKLMGNGSDVQFFTTGVGGIVPGIAFVMDNGDRYSFTFATGKPIIELFSAIASHISGSATRMANLFEAMHNSDEVGCPLTHQLFDKSLEGNAVTVESPHKPTSSHHH